MTPLHEAFPRNNARVGLYTKFPAINLYEYIVARFEYLKDPARILKVNTRTIAEWGRGGGTIDVMRADKFACRLGVHPCVIWPELWFEVSPEKEEAECRRRERQKQRRMRIAAQSSQLVK